MDSPLHNKKHIIFDFDTLVKLKLPHEIFRQRMKTKLAGLDSDLVDRHLKDKEATKLMNEAVKLHGENAKEIIFGWSEQFERDYFEDVHFNKELWTFIMNNAEKHVLHIWSDRTAKTTKRLLNRDKRYSYFKTIVPRESVDLPLPYPDGFFKIFDPKIHKRHDFMLVSHRVEFAQTAEDLGIEFLLVKQPL